MESATYFFTENYILMKQNFLYKKRLIKLLVIYLVTMCVYCSSEMIALS